MKRLLLSTAACAIGATAAQAGGIERSAFSSNFLFEEGDYVELSFARITPSVSGSLGGGLLPSGDMAPGYTTFGLAYKQQVTDEWAFGLTLDQPIGADVAYPAGTGYPLAATTADLDALAVTAIGMYSMPNNTHVYAGLRAMRIQGEVDLPASSYTLETSSETEAGWLVGAAWERPEIAARVALTYMSEINYDFTNTEAGVFTTPMPITIPQSVTLDFQTGIMEDTLLFGSVRWVDWSEFDITPDLFSDGAPDGNFDPDNALVNYESDTVTWNIGVGRRFTENFSAAVTLGYEEASGDIVGNLGPTDGRKSIGLAGTYTMDNVEITAGVQYIDLGDATTTIGAEFEGNSAIAAGVRIGYHF